MLEDAEFNKYNKFMLKWTRIKLPTLTDCPNPDCNYYFERSGEKHYRCESCKKPYCLECKVPYHDGMTCEEYAYHKDPVKQD